MKTKLLLAIPMVLLFSAHTLAATSDDTVATVFKNYMDIEKAEFFKQGWLPNYLPKSAVNIEVLHNTESKVITATFEFDADDINSIKDNCSLVAETENSALYSCADLNNDISFDLSKDGHGVYASKPLNNG
ncbi:hypothetical protein [Vibrio algarum]|uniref:YbbD head domain-containing protein n=1 Tax=Vibrio algarum TaxID=3020714 RepID=A0ABT4YQQ4_9VIBR|nr:hypothetical protein [Vibrio sp. KJ40-1]MDB1123418.1 hypothetical protein [Vibrio sp. KJ40-1]